MAMCVVLSTGRQTRSPSWTQLCPRAQARVMSIQAPGDSGRIDRRPGTNQEGSNGSNQGWNQDLPPAKQIRNSQCFRLKIFCYSTNAKVKS